jgi:hypothetical protein
MRFCALSAITANVCTALSRTRRFASCIVEISSKHEAESQSAYQRQFGENAWPKLQYAVDALVTGLREQCMQFGERLELIIRISPYHAFTNTTASNLDFGRGILLGELLQCGAHSRVERAVLL